MGLQNAGQVWIVLVAAVMYNAAVLAAGSSSLHPLSDFSKESAKQLFISNDDGSYGRYIAFSCIPDSGDYIVQVKAIARNDVFLKSS
jgi:hypothetical protein